MSRRTRLLLLALALAGAGVSAWLLPGSDHDPSPLLSARDSSGIRIVESAPPASADSCQIPSRPALEIGVREGEPEYQLHRVMDATRLSDGRLAVVNQGSDEIRLYGADGRFLHAFGRKGEGPGEFRNVLQIWSTPGDTLAVGDYRPWRYLFFTPGGELLRELEPSPRYVNSPDVMGLLDDGTFVLGRECCRSEAPGFHERQLHVLRHARSGELVDTVGVYPHGRRGVLSRRERSRFVGGPLFEPRARVAAAGHRIVVAEATEREVRILDPEGEIRTLVRWTGRDRSVTEEEVEAYREEILARYEDRPRARRRYGEPLVSEERPVNDRFPALGGLRLDEAGGVWVRKYPRPSWPEDDDMRWLVFRPDGRFLCHARTPPVIEHGWDLHEIGRDYLLATVRDEVGVEYVHLYRLRRGAG